MDEAKVGKLTKLLDRAMQNLVATSSDISRRPHDVRTYIRDLRQAHVSSGSPIRVWGFTLHTADAEAESDILAIIRYELRDYLHDDCIMPMATLHVGHSMTSGGYKVGAVLASILRTSILVGTGDAARRFFQCVENNESLYYEVTLVGGIRIENSFRLSDRVTLVPLPTKREEYSPYMHSPTGEERLFQRGQTFLVIEKPLSPVFSRPDTTDLSLLNRITKEDNAGLRPKELTEALSLICDFPIRQMTTWRHMKEDEVSKVGYVWSGQEYHGTANADIRSISERRDFKADDNHINEAMRIYRARGTLGNDVSEGLQVAFDRWMMSKVDRGRSSQGD